MSDFKEPLGVKFSFILLAGGKSRRMGSDKAMLTIDGKSFLEIQIEKARSLGISDLLISGHSRRIEGARNISDVYPKRGPLGGIYSCLKQAKNPHCIVLGVDIPLISADTLREMAAAHLNGDCEATIPAHGGRIEPLAGIYEANLADKIEPLIRECGAPVKALLDQIEWMEWKGGGEGEFLNCNFPENYKNILR